MDKATWYPGLGLGLLVEMPEGHPLAWDELRGYERLQGGYWLVPTADDPPGSVKRWVEVARPESSER